MNKTIKRSLVLVLPLLLVAATFTTPTDAASSVVHDARGDVGSAAPYLDVVHAKVTSQKGEGILLFTMVLAGSIPGAPSESDLIWPFHVDADPTTAPGGLYNEYVVRVRWFNGAFVGQVIDRTPLLTGGAPIVTPIPFEIDEGTVKGFVQLQQLGNPSGFEWNAATRPGATVSYVDFAPDGGSAADLATWTQ